MPPIFSAAVLLLCCSLTGTAKCEEAPKNIWTLQDEDYICKSRGFASPSWTTINRGGTHVSKLQLFQAKGCVGNQLAEFSLCLRSFAPCCPEPNSPASSLWAFCCPDVPPACCSSEIVLNQLPVTLCALQKERALWKEEWGKLREYGSRWYGPSWVCMGCEQHQKREKQQIGASSAAVGG